MWGWSTINTVFKTLTLKIHKPSKVKQHIMDEAMKRYAVALQTMLDAAREKPGYLSAMRTSNESTRTLAMRLMDKNLLRSLNDFHAQPFKDSLKIEFVNLLDNYRKRSLNNNRAAFPRVTISSRELAEKLELQNMSEGAMDKLYQKLDSDKTVYFCRYGDQRDYSLLYEPYKKRFYARLYLLNQHDELKHRPQKDDDSVLQVVGKNKLLPASQRPERYIIVPLSFGKEQEKHLLYALEHPDMLKTARLLKKNGEYYLIVSIALEPVPPLEVKGYAGFFCANDGKTYHTVCNLKGELLHQGILSEGQGMLPQAHDQLHILANAITDVCYRYRVQAVFENHPQYNRLINLLNYKLSLKGLQKPVMVSPFGLWQTCPRCGYNCKRNSTLGTVFLCTACGFGLEHVMLPAYNLSKRLIKYQGDKVRFHSEYIQHGRGRRHVIKNPLLDIHYTITPKHSLDKFFDFVQARTDHIKEHLKSRETNWSKEDKKLYSLWNKLINAKDIREAIEIES